MTITKTVLSIFAVICMIIIGVATANSQTSQSGEPNQTEAYISTMSLEDVFKISTQPTGYRTVETGSVIDFQGEVEIANSDDNPEMFHDIMTEDTKDLLHVMCLQKTYVYKTYKIYPIYK